MNDRQNDRDDEPTTPNTPSQRPRRRPPRRPPASDRPPEPGRRPPRKPKPGREHSAFDPWHKPSNEPADLTCPNTRLVAHEVNRQTGEMVEILRGCGRWSCRVCGLNLLRGHMAHFKEVLGPELDRLQFVTLTLRPGDAERLTLPEQVAALNSLFTNLHRRLSYRAKKTGDSVSYVAQVDLNPLGQKPHLHALIATDVTPGAVMKLWVKVGGALDNEILRVPSLDDLASLAGYVVEGSRWGATGRLRTSSGIGYNTEAARQERQRHAITASGGSRPSEWTFVPEPVEARERRARVPLETEPFESSAACPPVHRSKVEVGGREYAVSVHQNGGAEDVQITVDRVRRSGRRRRPSYTTITTATSQSAARRFIRRYDARGRQRLKSGS